MHLSKHTVAAASPRAKAYIAYDDTVPGLGLRVTPTGAKAYVLDYRVAPGGRHAPKRRLTLGKTSVMSPSEARHAALDALAAVRRGHDPQALKAAERASPSVSQLIDMYARDHLPKLKPTTQQGYKLALHRLRVAHGHLKAEELIRRHVAALHAGLSSTPYAANRLLATIASLYSYAARRDLVHTSVSPAKGVRPYREHRRERFLSDEEIGRLGAALHAAEGHIDLFALAAIKLLLFTGCRMREVLGARWSYVDWQRGLLVLLNEAALGVLKQLPRIEGNPFVIPGRGTGHRVNLHRPWRAVCKVAGLVGVRVHDLRHSHASAGAAVGLSLPLIGKLLGHSQSSTTQRYAHLSNHPVRAASEKVGEALERALEGREAKSEV